MRVESPGVGYRDELGAAEVRIRILEDQLEDARAGIARLRAPPAELAPQAPAALARSPRAPLVAGGVHYHPPLTYWPTLRFLLPALWGAARTSAPTLTPLASDSVAAWAFHHGVKRPVIALAWQLYWVSMLLLVLPVASALCFAGAVPLLPITVLSRLTFSPTPPEHASALGGEISCRAARAILWAICSLLVVPMLFAGRLLRSED